MHTVHVMGGTMLATVHIYATPELYNGGAGSAAALAGGVEVRDMSYCVLCQDAGGNGTRDRGGGLCDGTRSSGAGSRAAARAHFFLGGGGR